MSDRFRAVIFDLEWNPGMKRSSRLILGVVAVNLVLFELLSVVGVYALGVVRPDRRLDLFIDKQLETVDDARVREYLAGPYDEGLGWDRRASSDRVDTNVAGERWTASYDDLGARRSCIESTRTRMATYGDSFTHGDEVDDDQTWQCLLERRFGDRVLNFGVPAYGVGQALLKMKRHWQNGIVAPITLLAIFDSDLARVVNQYRPFINDSPGAELAFKPSYRYQEGGLRFLPNPLTPDVRTRDQVARLVRSVAATDYWESDQNRVVPGFPYSLRILEVGYHVVARRLVSTTRADTNIWDTSEGSEIMLHLLRDFVASARDVDTKPVLMFIPAVNEWKDGRRPPGYRRFLAEDLSAEELDTAIIDLSEWSFDEERFSVLPFSGHPSPYGNQIISDSIIDALEAQGVARFDARDPRR